MKILKILKGKTEKEIQESLLEKIKEDPGYAMGVLTNIRDRIETLKEENIRVAEAGGRIIKIEKLITFWTRRTPAFYKRK